jgi:hypothetical protein
VLCGSRVGNSVRIVETPPEHVEWQRLRYESGGYIAADSVGMARLTAGSYPLVRLTV